MLVLVRGAGDLASGICHRLFMAGFKVIATETPAPTMVRRTVSFGEAVFSGSHTVEGIKGVRVEFPAVAEAEIKKGNLPVLIDPTLKSLQQLKPQAIVDATMAKRNLGTNMQMAPVVVALGPGFTAGKDVHAVIETKRGHYLGRVIYEGKAFPNTGIPGEIAGYAKERLIKAPIKGKIKAFKKIGDEVRAGEIVCSVEGFPVKAEIPGILRGLIKEGLEVKEGMKVGDIDPRAEKEYCFTISDKARAVAGGVLEAILHLSGMIQNRS